MLEIERGTRSYLDQLLEVERRAFEDQSHYVKALESDHARLIDEIARLQPGEDKDTASEYERVSCQSSSSRPLVESNVPQMR